MKHYVYKITNLNPSDERKFYIGVRTSKNCLPIDDSSYMGSSKSLNKDIELFGVDNFKKEILKTFRTRELAVKEEIRLHDLYDVVVNKEFYNRAKQKVAGFDRSGFVNSDEAYELCSIKMKKLYIDEPERIEIIRKQKTGKNNHFYGRKHSPEALIKIGLASKKRRASKDTLKKLSIATSKENNPRAVKIHVFNKDAILQYEFHGEFHTKVKELNLPYAALYDSWRNNGKPIYQTKHGLSKSKRFGWEIYKGWYALKIQD